MAKKVKENNEVSAVRRSKHGGVLTVFFSLLTVFYLYPIFLVLINSFKKKGFITKNAFALPDERSFTGLSNFIRGIEKQTFSGVWLLGAHHRWLCCSDHLMHLHVCMVYYKST